MASFTAISTEDDSTVSKIVSMSELPSASSLLSALRAELHPELSSLPPHRDLVGDLRLLRFLEGYGGSVPLAAAAYRSMASWRTANNVEGIRELVQGKPLVPGSLPHSEDIIRVGRECGGVEPCLYACLALNGDLVHLELMGLGDPTLSLSKTDLTSLQANFVGFFELRQILFDSLSYSQCRTVKTVQLRDMSRFSLSVLKHHSAVSTFQGVLKSALANYPESLGRAVCVNSPAGLPLLWSGISFFLNKRMQDKISFLGTSYHEVLMEFLPAYAVARLDRFKRLPLEPQGEPNAPLPAEKYSVALQVAAGTPSRVMVYMAGEDGEGRGGKNRANVKWRLEGQHNGSLSIEVAFVKGVVVKNEGRAVVERNVVVERGGAEDDKATREANWGMIRGGSMDEEKDGFLEISVNSSARWFSTTVEIFIEVW